MSEASKNPRTMFSFQDTPPKVAYLDPSFLAKQRLSMQRTKLRYQLTDRLP